MKREESRVPLWRKIAHPSICPWNLYQHVSQKDSYSFLFENLGDGRFSYVGYSPSDTLNLKKQKDPLSEIRHWMGHENHIDQNEFPPGFPEWTGGAVGYLSYDFIRAYEELPIKAEDDLHLPDVYLMKAEEIFAFNNETGEIYCIVHVGEKCKHKNQAAGEKRLQEMIDLILHCPAEIPPVNRQHKNCLPVEIEYSLSQEQFEKAVRKIQDYISAGDVFQVNLSLRQSRFTSLTAQEIYQELRNINPSPYMGLFHFPEFQLISASPELLLRVKQGKVSTRPIAGTRKRGKTKAEDEFLEKELIQTEKENAEHIMLVDLERNDLGRVCKYGSVRVNEWMAIEKYSHVMHLVSNVEGELEDGKDMYDALVSVFPGGTITGAPKIRTMEIIEELEPVTRGPYTGTMALLGFNGRSICNIIIRTLTLRNNRAYVQAGAGIVIDSIPKAEYYESLKKAEALWQAVAQGEEKLSIAEKEESLV